MTPEETKARIKAFFDERYDYIDDDFLERRRTPAIAETHTSVLQDLIDEASYALEHSDYRRIAHEVSRFLEVPEDQAVNDPEFARIRREFTKELVALYEYNLKLLNGSVEPGERPTVTVASNAQTATGILSEPLSTWIEPYLAEKQKSRANIRENTSSSYRQYANTFVFLMGDMPVGDITRTVAEEFRDRLLQLPKHRNKRPEFRDKTAEELLALEVPKTDRISGRTANEHLTLMSGMFDWLHGQGKVDRNPFRGVSAPEHSKGYAEYTDADLQIIFSSELYVPGSAYATKRTTTAAHWWLPLVALYTGARPSELIQSLLCDVRIIDEILCLVIIDDEASKMVKTDAARRTVPIHADLLRLGFADYVAALRSQGASRVFDGIPLGRRKAGDQAGKWFNERYRSRHFPQFKTDRKVLYSFRHTHITKALNSGIETRAIQQWVGHESKQLGATKHYDRGMEIPGVFERINKVTWSVGALREMPQGWRGLQLH